MAPILEFMAAELSSDEIGGLRPAAERLSSILGGGASPRRWIGSLSAAGLGAVSSES